MCMRLIGAPNSERASGQCLFSTMRKATLLLLLRNDSIAIRQMSQDVDVYRFILATGCITCRIRHLILESLIIPNQVILDPPRPTFRLLLFHRLLSSTVIIRSYMVFATSLFIVIVLATGAFKVSKPACSLPHIPL